jgi:hypothetical protein
MKNTIFWIALVALSLQDLFKKQSPTKRQQQFFQTGGTAQAFIEGYETYTQGKKDLIRLLGKPAEIRKGFVHWDMKKGVVLELYSRKGGEYSVKAKYMTATYTETRILYNNIVYYDEKTPLKSVFIGLIQIYADLAYVNYHEDYSDYEKLNDMISAGDWELALEIAKGQELI